VHTSPVQPAVGASEVDELEHAGTLLRFFREFIPNAPEAYGAFPAFQVAPPLEFIPADRHGAFSARTISTSDSGA